MRAAIIRSRSTLAALLAAAALLGGCGTLNDQQAAALQNMIAGAQAIETSVAGAVPALLALPAVTAHLTPAELVAIKAASNGLVQATNALANVPTLTAGTTYVQTIETCLNVIVGIAATVPVVPEPYHTSLVVAALALPPVETLVGLAVTQGTALAAAIKARRIAAPAPAAPPASPPASPPAAPPAAPAAAPAAAS